MTIRPIYYDTETTGVKTDKDRIIEIAAYDPQRNRTFQSLVNPGCPIPQEAIAIHNITNEMVSLAPSFKEAMQNFIDFCEEGVILIAHNNDQFDLPILKSECERHQINLPKWKFLDTLKWTRRYRPDLPRHTLQFLRQIYQIPPNNAHRALDDVIILHQLFSLLLDDLDIETAHHLLYRPKTLQTMPFGKHQGQPLNQVPSAYIKWLASSGALQKLENQELKQSFELLGLLT